MQTTRLISPSAAIAFTPPPPIDPLPEINTGEFLPAILPQDRLRAKWRAAGLIDRQGRVAPHIPRDLPPFSTTEKKAIAEWVNRNSITIESSHPNLFWKCELLLLKVIGMMTGASPFPVGEIALIGSTVKNLNRPYAQAGLQSYGFIFGEEKFKPDPSLDTDVRFWMSGDIVKGDLRKCLKELILHLKNGLPEKLKGRDAAKILQEAYPDKYKEEIPEAQIADAVVGNTAFLKLHVLDDKEQLSMTASFGDRKSPPLEIIAANKLKNTSLFSIDDQRIEISSLLNPAAEGIRLLSDKGSTQAAVDCFLGRVRLTYPDKCDSRAYFRYFIAQIKGLLIDEPKDVEKILFEQVRSLDEKAFAQLLCKCASNHLPPNPLSVLLLLVNTLACAETLGAQWNFNAIAEEVHKLAKLTPPGSEGQALYDAIFRDHIPFSQIEAALQTAAFFHLFTNPEEKMAVKAVLTESFFAPAMQWQFGCGASFLVPLKVPDRAPSSSLLEALMPKSFAQPETRQATLSSLPLPDLIDLSEKLEPLPAFHCLLAHPGTCLPQVLDLFFSGH